MAFPGFCCCFFNTFFVAFIHFVVVENIRFSLIILCHIFMSVECENAALCQDYSFLPEITLSFCPAYYSKQILEVNSSGSVFCAVYNSL